MNRFLAWAAWGAILAASVHAEDRSPVFIALQGGVGAPLTPSDFTDLHEPTGGLIGLRLGYQPSYRWAVGGQFSNYELHSDTQPTQDVRLQPIAAFVQWDWPWTWYLTPYAVAQAGLSRNRKEHFGRSETDLGWMAGVGAGLRIRYSEFGDLELEAGVRNFSQATIDNKNLTLADVAVVLRFYLPESWVPRKPPEDWGVEDLEIPVATIDDTPEVDEALVLQGKINRLQGQINSGDFAPLAFEPGGTILLTTAFNALDNLGAILRLHPDVRVRIYGYVEPGYSGTAREALAFGRAEVVKTYLIQNFRLLDSRLFTEGERPLPAPEQGRPAPQPSQRMEFETLPSMP